MSEAYLTEIRIFGFDFAPRNWALCNGQLLSIAQYSAVFSLLGTTYGGDGRTTFALPDLRGRVPMHVGSGTSGHTVTLGEKTGAENHTLIVAEMPAHNHGVKASSAVVNEAQPGGHVWGKDAQAQSYHSSAAAAAQMNTGSIANTGGGQLHNNMAPYLVMNMSICIQGIFPPRN
jgi:microcystin-dependent protein